MTSSENTAALHTCTGEDRGLSPAQLTDRCPACQALLSMPVEIHGTITGRITRTVFEPHEIIVHVFDEEPCPPHETEPGVCAAHGARVVEVWW